MRCVILFAVQPFGNRDGNKPFCLEGTRLSSAAVAILFFIDARRNSGKLKSSGKVSKDAYMVRQRAAAFGGVAK